MQPSKINWIFLCSDFGQILLSLKEPPVYHPFKSCLLPYFELMFYGTSQILRKHQMFWSVFIPHWNILWNFKILMTLFLRKKQNIWAVTMTWFDVFQGELHSHEFNSPYSGLQLAFFPRTSYNWFSFFRPAYTGFQPFREEILTYVEQQYLEKLFYMPCWAFLISFALLLWSRTLDSTIRGILTLVLVVWVQWLTFGQRSLCDDSVQNPLWF